MIGIMTEKPSQAKNFAKALGGMSGTFAGQSYRIVAAAGHLYELKDPADMVPADLHDKIKSWDVANLPWDERNFRWGYRQIKGRSNLIKEEKNTLASCDEICIAGDIDPSGEGFGIQWEIITNLKLHPAKFSRMYFADESAPSIQKAFRERVRLTSLEDNEEWKKYNLRSKWDLLSMQWTRIATALVPGSYVIYEGRLKSAMVRLVGDQLDAIAKYKKIPSYTNQFKDDHGVIYKSKDEPLFKTQAEVPQKYRPSSVVVDARTKKTSAPPKLLDLSAISGILAPKGYKPSNVQTTYQKMYENQVVSYPRTEDKKITPEQFNELLPKVDAIAKVVGIDPSLLTHREMRKTHIGVGCAHGANRPGPNVPKSLGDVESEYGKLGVEIYKLVASSFLCMFGEDYEYISEKGHIADYPSFIGSCTIPTKMGYKAILNDTDDEEENDNNANGLGKTANPFIAEIIPKKPSAPTVKWIMKQLESYDIGTGATRTSTLAAITSSKAKYPLMNESRGKLSLAPCGERSYILLPGTYIADLDITKRLFDNMKSVAKNELNTADLLHEVQDMIRHDMPIMKANAKKGKGLNMSEEFQSVERVQCTLPDGTSVKFKKAWGGHTFTDDEINRLASGEEISFEAHKRAGGTFTATGKLALQTYNGHEYWGFQLSPRGIPDKWCDHVFTPEEKSLLESGARIKLTGVRSLKKPNSQPFDCELEYVTDASSGSKKLNAIFDN